MSLTVRELALRLAELVNQGHGDNLVAIDTHQPLLIGRVSHVGVTNVVAGRDWNHGACLLWPAEVLTRLSGTVPAVDSGLITAVEVERDEDGFWTHPAHPDGIESGEDLNEWFTRNNLTYTTNYLLPPENADETNEWDYSAWELRQPAGNGWFLWDIRTNAEGDPIAVWAHNL